MKVVRLALAFSVAASLSTPASATEMIIDEAEGGWSGGDVAMVCERGSNTYEVFIFDGIPGIRLNGEKVGLWAATLRPYGFLSFLKEYENDGRVKDWIFYAGDFEASVLGIKLLYAGDLIRVECNPARIAN